MLASIVASNPNGSSNDEVIIQEDENMSVCREKLFRNALATLTVFNEVISRAVVLVNPLMETSRLGNSTAKKDALAEVKKRCAQTDKWATVMQETNEKCSKTETGKGLSENNDNDLVIDEEIVIIGGKAPSERDLNCPISLKPFKEPMCK